MRSDCITYINSCVTFRKYRESSLQMWRVTCGPMLWQTGDDACAMVTRQASLSSGIEWLAGAIDVIDVGVLLCVFEAAAENRALLLPYLVLLLLFSLSLALALALFCLQLRHKNMNLLSPVLILFRHFTWNPLLQFLHGVSEWPWRGGWKHFAHSSLLRMVEGVDIL